MRKPACGYCGEKGHAPEDCFVRMADESSVRHYRRMQNAACYPEPITFRALKPRDFYPPPERGHSTTPGVVTLLPRI